MWIPLKYKNNKIVLLLLLYFLMAIPSHSSSIDTIEGQVSLTIFDSETFSPLCFAIVSSGDSTYISDVQGKISLTIEADSIWINVAHPLYLSKSVWIKNTCIKTELSLIRKIPFIKEKVTNQDSKKVIKKILQYKPVNDLNGKEHYSFNTYNKISFSPGDSTNNKKLLSKLYRVFSGKLREFDKKQHFFLLENTSQKNVKSELFRKETITGVKSSDISVPLLVIETSQLNASSIYDNWLKIGGKQYESPLSSEAIERYIFSLEDTIFLSNDTLLRIKYNPNEAYFFRGLKGYMYISTKKWAVKYYDASPAFGEQLETYRSSSFQYINNQWYPYQVVTRISSEKTIGKPQFDINIFSQFFNISTSKNFLQKDFDETILEYKSKSETVPNEHWEKYRTIPLTKQDSLTYQFYNKVDKNKLLQKTLRFGENIYFGFLPIGKVNVLMNRILNFNQVEKLRIGFGFETNQKFSEKNKIGAFLAYGIGDKRWKYGLNYSRLLHKNKDVYFESIFYNELKEAGYTSFSFDRNQYPSEAIRAFSLQIMDKVICWENGIAIHPFNYLDARAGISISQNKNLYSYKFQKKDITQMNFFETYLGIRYALGESNIKYDDHLKYLPSRYPIFYLKASQGFDAAWGEYAYSRLELKIEQYLRSFRLGISQFQILYTLASKDAPYTKLFNGKGSQQNGSIVIHNSFETMRFNEFLSDEFIGLFISHEFNKLFTPYSFIQPNLTLLHNMGIGNISKPNLHLNLPFTIKAMNRGYLESGIFFSNLLVARINGLKIGLGLGLMYRYGFYASQKASENTVFKFALSFKL
ncbi:MAG: hypothetical protein EAZ07_07375 [Cytophagales bacterium]|nr:MAG: hypothetical protein EAZ07_07375 [Cytophagales bacterium]